MDYIRVKRKPVRIPGLYQLVQSGSVSENIFNSLLEKSKENGDKDGFLVSYPGGVFDIDARIIAKKDPKYLRKTYKLKLKDAKNLVAVCKEFVETFV